MFAISHNGQITEFSLEYLNSYFELFSLLFLLLSFVLPLVLQWLTCHQILLKTREFVYYVLCSKDCCVLLHVPKKFLNYC